MTRHFFQTSKAKNLFALFVCSSAILHILSVQSFSRSKYRYLERVVDAFYNISSIRESSKNDTHSNTTLHSTERDQTELDTANLRLEFLHIPKTGGSVIEIAAGTSGVAWGLCHFNIHNKLKCCPILNLTAHPEWTRQPRRSLWHFPLQLLPKNLPSDPYNNLGVKQQQADSELNKEVVFFTVVRNPYERMVSEYYYSCPFRSDCASQKEAINRASQMNEFLTRMLLKINKDPFHSEHHYLPQHDYVFDSSGNPMVKHVLRFENLQAEFSALMKQYSLNISLPLEKGPRSRPSHSRLGVQNLTKETLQLIEKYYEKDFALGNYTMLTETPGANFSQTMATQNSSHFTVLTRTK